MTKDKGNSRATVIPEAGLPEKLSQDPKLDRTIQTRIGDQLRSMYDGLMEQPVPDRFKDLLAQLEKNGREES